MGRGNANPAALNLDNYRGAWEIFPFVNHTFEWGVATVLSVSSIVPRHCAILTYFFHPKLRGINAVLIAPQQISLLQRLRHARSVPRATSSPPLREQHPCQSNCSSGFRNFWNDGIWWFFFLMVHEDQVFSVI